MKCHDAVQALAATVGASLDACTLYDLIVDAPRGYYWADSDTTILCQPCASNAQAWHADACRDVVARMRKGLYLCDADQSAATAWDRDEPWTADANAPATLTP